jgi:hypothetical protein
VFLTYILGPILTLLPERWRAKVLSVAPVRAARAAIISGIAEGLFAIGTLIVWYSIYVALAANAITRSSLPGGDNPRIGIFGLIWFWSNPITWLVVYFILEGATRYLAALTTGEVFGTFPLYAVEYAVRRIKQNRAQPELPLVTDEVLPGGATCDMKIASCRAKAEWQYPFTIRYGGAYFQVVASLRLGAGPRPHVYSLRRLPPGEVAGGLKEYHPEDVLTLARSR